MKCRYEGCPQDARARGWCIRHYYTMTYNHRVPFTRQLWDRWLNRLNGGEFSPQYRHLAQGITAFRRVLAEKEPET